MDVLLDVSPVEVRGPVRATRARVIYADGTLYVVKNANEVHAFTVPEPTKTDPRRSQFEAEGGLKFYKRGCGSCGYTLGRIPAADLIAKAAPA